MRAVITIILCVGLKMWWKVVKHLFPSQYCLTIS